MNVVGSFYYIKGKALVGHNEGKLLVGRLRDIPYCLFHLLSPLTKWLKVMSALQELHTPVHIEKKKKNCI